MTVFSIGEFSKISGLTVKTLRFYHEQGLLLPTSVDEGSGYRYYGPEKIEAARVIRELRALEFSVSEIAVILQEARSEEALFEILRQHKVAMQAKIQRSRAIVRALDRFLDDEREARRIMTQASFEVEEKVLEPIRVAGVRMRGRYEDCGPVFARIGRSFGRHLCGKPLMLHYDCEYREHDADFEPCMPVRGGQARDGDGIDLRELAGGRCVSLLHQGPYDQLGRSYARVLQFIKERGYEVVLPTREVYHKGPGMFFRGNPRNYLTEIQMLVSARRGVS